MKPAKPDNELEFISASVFEGEYGVAGLKFGKSLLSFFRPNHSRHSPGNWLTSKRE
jgi:hypothetical protein